MCSMFRYCKLEDLGSERPDLVFVESSQSWDQTETILGPSSALLGQACLVSQEMLFPVSQTLMIPEDDGLPRQLAQG